MDKDSSNNTSAGDQIGELERLGPDGSDALILGVEAPGFENLTRDQRRFAYYLYRAAVAGNTIAYKQCHRDAYQIKQLLESIHLASDGLDPELRRSIHDYLKFVWIHHGQYDHYTHTKFKPNSLTPEGLRQAAAYAHENGATLALAENETVDQLIDRLEPSIFDTNFEPLQTNQSEGEDIVAGSAVNYWDRGVTAEDLDGLDESESSRPNVRFAKKDGHIVPEVYRIGGVYSQELETINHFLRLAVRLTDSEEQQKSIEALIRHYESGKEEDFRQHSVHWLKSNNEVDYVNGFIEVYLDPRGIIGQFEGNVSFRAGGGLIDQMADNAQYFEKRMPWPDKYKRTEISRPVANVVNVLVETGDAGPVSPAAYNLPNYNDLRRDHGSKNVILHNIENTWSEELLKQTVEEFYLPQYRENMLKFGRTLIRPLEVYMHEIIGHGSGQPDENLAGDPRSHLGRVYSALEECRADLVALWHIADPKLIEMGAFTLFEQRPVVETMYISFLQGWFSRLDRVPGLEVREAHNKGNHAILMYLVEGGGEDRDYGVEIVAQDGDFFVSVGDLETVRNGIGDLLRKIQVIKSTGNREAAEELFDKFGTHLDERWKLNITARKKKLCAPKIKAFVFPRLEPVFENGELVDVKLFHDEDLTAQQLRFSRLENSTSLDESSP
jgi:dipeptidyl-peptidase III